MSLSKQQRRFAHIKTHLIRGKRYRVKWRRPSSKTWVSDGHVDHPAESNKSLYIYPGGSPLSLLDTVFHEHIHGALPDIEEGAVRDICKATKRLLKRMGVKLSFGK